MFKRRDFLTTCAAGTAAFMTPVGWVMADSAGDNSSKDTFQSLLHQGFRCMDGEDEAMKLELVEVREGPKAPGLEQFTLVFQGGNSAETRQLQAGLYRLYHPETGLELLHLTPSDTGVGRYTTHFGLFT